MENPSTIGNCRFCGFPGSYSITEIENGRAVTFALCRDHAHEKGPHSEGVIPFAYCPVCERKMNIVLGLRQFAYCDLCDALRPYIPPGIRAR
jgi:hypothetical protein